MKKNVQMVGTVVGASANAIHSIKAARELGVYVVALDGNPEAEGLSWADAYIIADIGDCQAVSKVIRDIEADFIIPVPIGRFLSTVGYINELFGFKGILRHAGIYSTDKHLFHKKLQEAKLRNIHCYLLKKGENVKESYDLAFPGIIKPRYGSGSRDLYFFNSESELADTAKRLGRLKEDFVLEEAVAGQEYGVDGAVVSGRFQMILMRKKIITDAPLRQAVSDISIIPDGIYQPLYHQVTEFLDQVTAALQMNECLINADIILNNEGIFVIEISARPSGHYLHDVFVPLCTGIDMSKEYINYLMGNPYRFIPEYTKSMQIRFFDFEDCIIESVPEQKELMRNEACNLIKWECNIKPGDKMGKVIDGHSIMGRGYFIVEGENEMDMHKKCEWILGQFKIRSINL